MRCPLLFRGLLSAAVLAAFGAADVAADPWYQHYDQAAKALAAEDWATAVAQLNEAIARKGDSGARVRTYGMKFTDYFPYLKLGIAYYHLGQLDAALQAFDTEERLGALGEAEEAQKELRDFRARVEEARDEQAAGEERRVQRIVTETLAEVRQLESGGRLDEALVVLGRALAVAPEDTTAQAALARLRTGISRQQADRRQAARIADLVEEGRGHLARGEYDEATRSFRQALAEKADPRVEALLDQAQTALRAELEKQEVAARRELVANALAKARELESAGELGPALDELETALALDSTNAEARELQSRLLAARKKEETENARQAEVARLLTEARDELQAGGAEQSLSRANQALALDPGNASALEIVSRAYRTISRRLLGSAARENIPPAISVADFRQERDDGSRVERVASPDFRLSGVVIDDAAVDLVIEAGNDRVASQTHAQNVGDYVLTEFHLERRLSPGTLVLRLVATDPQGLRATRDYAVEYVRPLYRAPVFYAALAAAILASALAWAGHRAWQRKKRRERRFNPYVAGAPILDGDLFFGRRRLIERILQTVHNNSLLLYGERRIGKTSIQHHLLRRLSELEDPRYAFYPVYIDLQGTPEERFFATLAEEIFQELAPVTGGLEPSPADGYGYRDLVRDLRRLLGVLGEKSSKRVKLVLLIDEVDELNDYDPKVNQKLRSLFMKSFAESLVAVVSGVAIKKTWHREASPWYNFFEEIEVKPFREQDARELVERPIRGLFRLEKGVTDRIVELSGGRPYAIQKMCMGLVQRLYEENRRKITLADVEAARPSSVEN